HPHHILFRDVALEEPLRRNLHEIFRVGRVLHVTVESDDSQIYFSDCCERLSKGLSCCYRLVAGLVTWRRIRWLRRKLLRIPPRRGKIRSPLGDVVAQLLLQMG